MIGSTLSRMAAAEKLTIGQLKEAIQNGTVPAYVGIPMLEDKMKKQKEAQAQAAGQQAGQPPIAQEVMQQAAAQGVEGLPSGLPTAYAGGGIIAFADGDVVEDEEDDDSTSDAYDRMFNDSLAQNQMLIAQLKQAGQNAPVGLPAIGINPERPSGVGIREDARAPRGLESLEAYVVGKESGGRDYDKNGNPLTSSKGAKYAMQVMPATAKKPGFGIEPAKDDSAAEYNRVGRQLLAKLYDKYGDEKLAAAAYNWGSGNVDKWLASGKGIDALPNETRKYIAQLAEGGAIHFQNRGEVKDKEEDEDSGIADYLGYGLLAPDVLRLGSQIVRGAPSLPPGSLSGLGTAGARTLGSIGTAATTAGVPSTIGYGGYKLSKSAAKTLARPEAKEFRQNLMSNPLLGATSGDTSMAAAILEMQSPEYKERYAREQAVLKNAPWYTRAYGIGQREFLEKNMAREPGLDAGVFGPPVSAMDKEQAVKNNVAEAVKTSLPAEVTNALKTEGDKGKGGDAESPSTMMAKLLSEKEAALAKGREEDKYLALLSAGLGMMGAQGPNALQNIGQGAMQGVQARLASNKLRAAEEANLLKGRLGMHSLGVQEQLRRDTLAQNQEVKYAQMLKDAKVKAMNAIAAVKKIDLKTLEDANVLATIEREADNLLAKDAGYQNIYKKIYGGEFAAPAMAAPSAGVYTSTYGLTPRPTK